MSKISIEGENWAGSLSPSHSEAHGSINGYTWYLNGKKKCWSLEIAEDQSLSTEDLPLVGFGCSGWLYQAEPNTDLNTQSITDYLNKAFLLFVEDRLTYLPAVNCNCSD